MVTPKEFEYLKSVYTAIKQNNSCLKIEGSATFKKEVLSSLRIILSTEAGKHLIYGLHTKNSALFIKQDKSPRYSLCPNQGKRVSYQVCYNEVFINKKKGYYYSGKALVSEQKDNEHRLFYYGAPDSDKVGVKLSQHEILFHELTHAYHDLVTDDIKTYSGQKYSLFDNEFPWTDQEEKRTILKTNAFRRQLKMGEEDWYGRWGHIGLFSEDLFSSSNKIRKLFVYRLRLYDSLKISDTIQQIYRHHGVNLKHHDINIQFIPSIDLDLIFAANLGIKDWQITILNSERAGEISLDNLKYVMHHAINNGHLDIAQLLREHISRRKIHYRIYSKLLQIYAKLYEIIISSPS